MRMRPNPVRLAKSLRFCAYTCALTLKSQYLIQKAETGGKTANKSNLSTDCYPVLWIYRCAVNSPISVSVWKFISADLSVTCEPFKDNSLVLWYVAFQQWEQKGLIRMVRSRAGHFWKGSFNWEMLHCLMLCLELKKCGCSTGNHQTSSHLCTFFTG